MQALLFDQFEGKPNKYIFLSLLSQQTSTNKKETGSVAAHSVISVTDVTEYMWIVCYIILNNKNQAITYVLLSTVMHSQCYVTPLQGGKCWERKCSLYIATEAAAAARVL